MRHGGACTLQSLSLMDSPPFGYSQWQGIGESVCYMISGEENSKTTKVTALVK